MGYWKAEREWCNGSMQDSKSWDAGSTPVSRFKLSAVNISITPPESVPFLRSTLGRSANLDDDRTGANPDANILGRRPGETHSRASLCSPSDGASPRARRVLDHLLLRDRLHGPGPAINRDRRCFAAISIRKGVRTSRRISSLLRKHFRHCAPRLFRSDESTRRGTRHSVGYDPAHR